MTTALTSTPAFGDDAACRRATAACTEATSPVIGAERLAAQRHGQADFQQRDVGGLGGGVGAFDQRGDVERFEDAQRAVGFRRLGAAQGGEDVRVHVRNDELVDEAAVGGFVRRRRRRAARHRACRRR